MFVAQITEPAEQGQQQDQFEELTRRFPQYQFSILMGRKPCVIARPDPKTVKYPDDEGTEVEILRYILTMLLDEHITGHLITDEAPKKSRPDQYDGPES